MLAGRYPSDEFAELRPRIVWDRIGGTVRGRDGARRLAVMSGGTIPDRGLYGVFLADSGARVGELDEEMVYEARQGEVFQLGATSWRIEQITRDRVLVSPAPGRARQDAVLEGRRRRPAVRAGHRGRRGGAHPPVRRPGRAGRPQPDRLPGRPARGDGRRPRRPHRGRRAVPRRDRRLADLHPVAVRRPGARALGDGDRGANELGRRRSRSRRCGRTTASPCGCPTPTSRRRSS